MQFRLRGNEMLSNLNVTFFLLAGFQSQQRDRLRNQAEVDQDHENELTSCVMDMSVNRTVIAQIS